MDLTSAKDNERDAYINTLRALCDIKSQLDEIPVTNDSDLNSRLVLLQRIHEFAEKLIKDNICKPLIEIPHPLPPMKIDIGDDEYRKEVHNDTCDQKGRSQ